MTEPEKDPEDLLEIFTKPIDDMELPELKEKLKLLRKLRSVKISTIKKKTELDMILERLTPELAQKALESLEPKEQKEEKEKEKAKKNE